jgi:predicted phosphodiesterase
MVLMSISDELNNFLQAGKEGSDDLVRGIPEGWRPRSEIDNNGGFIVSTPRPDGNTPGAEELLREANLDPAEWAVTSSRKSRWQRYDGEWLESFRLNVVPLFNSAGKDYDAEKLIEEIKNWAPTGKVNDKTGKLTAVYSIGDTQYGKDDTSAIVERVLRTFDEAVEHHRFLMNKYEFEQIALPQIGDCIEGMTSQKGKVMGRHDIGVAQQVQVGRRVLMAQIKSMAQFAPKIIVPVVPGNHDEVQRFLVSRPEDSWQIEIVRAVEDACLENDFLKDRVEFRYPAKDDSTLAVNLSGVLYGMAHGHQKANMVNWWQGQVMGRCAVANADILNVGHLHHYDVQSVGTRLFIQNPAMDNGSSWWRDKAGLESHPGIVSLVVGEGFDARRELVVLGGFR